MNAQQMVMAHGDAGMEPTPESEVVTIRAIYQVNHPAFPHSSPMVPATARGFFGHRPEEHPSALLGIDPAGRDMGNGHVTPWPYVRYSTAGGSWSACFVRHEADARDPWFKTLPRADRAAILAALKAGVTP